MQTGRHQKIKLRKLHNISVIKKWRCREIKKWRCEDVNTNTKLTLSKLLIFFFAYKTELLNTHNYLILPLDGVIRTLADNPVSFSFINNIMLPQNSHVIKDYLNIFNETKNPSSVTKESSHPLKWLSRETISKIHYDRLRRNDFKTKW